MALNSATNELFGVERKLLEALQISYDHWKQNGGVTPPSLVKLMTETHACIRERIKRQFGIDSNASLREMLVECRQLEQQLLEMIELEEAQKELQ